MQYEDFINQFSSLILATSNSNIPHSSYSTFVSHNGYCYILISDIAPHSTNLKKNPFASLLFIEDEKSSANIFARERVNIYAECDIIDKDTQEYIEVIALYHKKFDTDMVSTLTSLDFYLYKMSPKRVNTYFGFGMAQEFVIS